jgi:hypothetical protein
MLSVTPRAVDVLARTLRDGDADTGHGFRVVPAGPGQIALALDSVREGDHVVRLQEQTVIMVDEWVSNVLDGAVLDVEEQDDGTSLALYGSGRLGGY